MDKQQYHLISYDIILINFPQPQQTQKSAEVKFPKCQWTIHTSTRFRNVLSSCIGQNFAVPWTAGQMAQLVVVQYYRNLKKEPTCIILKFYGLPKKNLNVFVVQWCFLQWFLCNHLEDFPQNLRSYWNDICIRPSLRYSNQTSPQKEAMNFLFRPSMKHLHHKRTIPSKTFKSPQMRTSFRGPSSTCVPPQWEMSLAISRYHVAIWIFIGNRLSGWTFPKLHSTFPLQK